MKRFISALLFVLLLFLTVFNVVADVQIDLPSLKDEELLELKTLINEELINRAKMNIPATGLSEEGAFTFRGVSWYTNRKESEKILGVTSDKKGPSNIQRLSFLDFAYSSSGRDTVEDVGGVTVGYPTLKIGGLTPSTVAVCYIYPIVDGIVIRDDDLAQLYFGFYKFGYGDFEDYQSIYDDLKRKITATYGEGFESPDKYWTKTFWKDNYDNCIQLLIDDDCNYVALGYIAADADARLDEMEEAIKKEKEAEEAIEREKNENNLDGI